MLQNLNSFQFLIRSFYVLFRDFEESIGRFFGWMDGSIAVPGHEAIGIGLGWL